jgi:hypothetical protein
MTTAALQALSGSALSAAFARAFEEVQTFFDASSAAVARAGREQPFAG